MNVKWRDSSRAPIPCQVHFVCSGTGSLFWEQLRALSPVGVPLPVTSSGSAKPGLRRRQKVSHSCCFSFEAHLPAAQGLLLSLEESPQTHLPYVLSFLPSPSKSCPGHSSLHTLEPCPYVPSGLGFDQVRKPLRWCLLMPEPQ